MLQAPRKANEDEEEEEEDPDEAEERQQQMQLLQNEVKSRTPRQPRPFPLTVVISRRLAHHPQCGGRASSRRRSTATCGRTSRTRTGTWASASTKTSRLRRGSILRPSAASTSAPQSVRRHTGALHSAQLTPRSAHQLLPRHAAQDLGAYTWQGVLRGVPIVQEVLRTVLQHTRL